MFHGNKNRALFWTNILIIVITLLLFFSCIAFIVTDQLLWHPNIIPSVKVKSCFVRHHELNKYDKLSYFNFKKNTMTLNSQQLPLSFIQVFTPPLEEIENCVKTKCWPVIQRINQLTPIPEIVLLDTPFRPSIWQPDRFQKCIKKFYKLLDSFHKNITFVFVPAEVSSGPFTPEASFTLSILQEYKDNFGSDHFEFFVKGSKFIVINSNFDYLSFQQNQQNQNQINPLGIELSDSKSEQEAWLSLSLEDSRGQDTSQGKYQGLIVIRSGLRGFQDNSTSMDPNSNTMRAITMSVLDDLTKYPGVSVVSFEGRDRGKDNPLGSTNVLGSRGGKGLKTEYKRIKSIFLASGLSSRSYRVFTLFGEDVEQQIVY